MILFTADVHIKLGQKSVPVDWAKDRYFKFFDLINSVKCDAHVVGGDIFDRIPSIEELELYFRFVSECTVPTYIFSGNHEATKKGATFLSKLKNATNLINNKVNIIDEVIEFEWGTIVPYNKIKEPNVFKPLNKNIPLFTHVRGEIPPHVKPEIPLELLAEFPVVFAGDLHSHSNSQRNIVYPGSPMTTSFHRSEVSTGYLLIDGVDWTWHELDLPQLIRKTVSSTEDMVPTNYHHTIYEIEGDVSDLSKIKDNPLLDKKIVRRSSDVSLILTKDMTEIDELREYLLYILELPEDKVASVLGTFNDYTTRT